jgi:hypothetical protein
MSDSSPASVIAKAAQVLQFAAVEILLQYQVRAHGLDQCLPMKEWQNSLAYHYPAVKAEKLLGGGCGKGPDDFHEALNITIAVVVEPRKHGCVITEEIFQPSVDDRFDVYSDIVAQSEGKQQPEMVVDAVDQGPTSEADQSRRTMFPNKFNSRWHEIILCGERLGIAMMHPVRIVESRGREK